MTSFVSYKCWCLIIELQNIYSIVNFSHRDSFRWQIISTPETIKFYEIYCNDQLVGIVSGDQSKFTATGLAPATTYAFMIRAQGQDNSFSDYSEALSSSSLQQAVTPLTPPTQLRSEVQSDTTIN
ncbi:fibronectin type III domain-containing protein [Paenibacillus phoenicis]|uniref:fibronectin type III domain-containing protein n=1 Tax=Paenibacillus phoenicis TaxID=554117 RepID=UPI0039F129D3